MDKTVILLHGLPGSGKSTWARTFASVYPNESVICSADDYHIHDGVYSFDYRRMGYAHAQCLELFKKSLEDGVKIVLVDNCNVRYREIKKYLNLAIKYDYSIWLVETTASQLPSEELAARNLHGVTAKTVDNIRKKFISIETMFKLAKQNIPEFNANKNVQLRWI